MDQEPTGQVEPKNPLQLDRCPDCGYPLRGPQAPGPVQLRLSPRGYGTRRGRGAVRLTPWPRRLRVHVFPLSMGYPAATVPYCCLVTQTNLPGLNIHGPHALEFVFEAGPEVAAQIQSRLRAWGVRAV